MISFLGLHTDRGEVGQCRVEIVGAEADMTETGAREEAGLHVDLWRGVVEPEELDLLTEVDLLEYQGDVVGSTR